MSDVQVGQIWQEVDPRQERFVKVMAVRATRAIIWRCNPDGSAYPKAVQTSAKVSRFNGKRGGYMLYHDAEMPQ